MKFAFIALSLLFAPIAAFANGQAPLDDFALVKGGTFKHEGSSFFGQGVTVSDFYMGKYEVTQKEWNAVMESNPSQFIGDHFPVEMVSWYSSILYCNKRSEREGLEPYYTIDKEATDPNNFNEFDEMKWRVTLNESADGYRLPTEAEWEYAATGGQRSNGFRYSGSDELDDVGWYWRNCGTEPLQGLWNWPLIEQNGSRTQPVGQKAPNELGIFDLSGNVREWCWDWHGELQFDQADPKGDVRGANRVWKGGGWVGGDFCCEPSFRGSLEPHTTGFDQGFRLCRNVPASK